MRRIEWEKATIRIGGKQVKGYRPIDPTKKPWTLAQRRRRNLDRP